jgi:PAS domain S-box-containing protein
MLFHQTNELAAFFATGEFRFPLVGESLETSANLIAAGSVYYVLAFTRQERKLSETLAESREQLEQTTDQLELIFENVNDGILLVDLNKEEIVEANEPAHELLRYDRGELVGLSPYDIHPHEPERFRELSKMLQPDGGIISDNLSCRRSDGSTMPAAVSASRTDLDEGNLMLITIRDNTVREQYRTQVDLLGRVLRHNLRNDMTVVMGRLGNAKQHCDDPEVVEAIDSSLEKCQNLVAVSDKTRKLNKILDSEQRQIKQLVDLVPLVKNILNEYKKEFPTASIETELPESATVRANNDVRWGIENLVENALVHTDENPVIKIVIGTETIETEGRKSEWTTITVADHGPGIPADEVAVLRDDTTRTATDHGSGLGLWVVQQIAQTFDGQLTIDRDPDSTFTTEVKLHLQPYENKYEPISQG